MSSLKRIVPPAFRPTARTLYHGLFRIQLRMGCWYADRFRPPPLEVPLPPAMLRFRVSETLSAREFLRVGAGCANLIQQHVAEMGIDLAHAGRVLDFGCGCGRTLRWLLGGEAGAELHGVDVDADAIDWCKKHLDRAHFLATAPTPPLPYPTDYFDVVYCLSVFTHLDESMQDIWLAELNRILKPGGVLLVTIHGTAATQGLDAEDRRLLREHGFVHKRSKKLKGLAPDWYQTSWHSREYIVGRLSARFEDVRYSVIPDGLQDVVVARKPT